MSLLASAAAWLKKDTAASPRQEAADVAAFLASSRRQHEKFNLYVRALETFTELTRRSRPSLADQLEPHFNLLWRSVWPVLSWIFPQTLTGPAVRRLLAQLGTHAD